MPKNRGATLIEALLALAISWIILVAFLGAIRPLQTLAWNLSAFHDRDSTLCLAPPLLCKWTAGAGNNRAKESANCLKQAGVLYLRSDSDGADGFPDGDLDESYESISIRQNGTDLQIKSGNGTFQPVFRNVSTLEVETIDPLVVGLKIGAQTDKTLLGTPQTEPRRAAFQVYLWNRRPNLFEEKP